MKWEIYKTLEEASKKTAQYIVNELNLKPNLNLCLPTGSTPINCLNEMVKLYEEGKADFSKANIYNMDEYVGLGKTHPEGYYYFLQNHLYSKTNVDLAKTYSFDALDVDLNKQCKDYTNIFYKNGVMDVMYLGIGTDGHIAFNMPKEIHYLNAHLENLSSEALSANAKFFNNVDEVPTQAITIGIGMILKSKRIVLNAFGKSKAETIKQLYENPVIDPQLPATFLNLHEDLTIIIDKDAASLINEFK
ncbi:hypothetical protein AN639_04285 [Candidatus Epulonipiscium fishelsonii]|uniref:Uncharacterized protein n=1 Tax=Candidatus Epulonipiscium fishelsonii TaxID=77094 RepID=A0ACC8XFS4_9FIRM|nr:hypothetical protein AN639_04285 [Epulopiscium sp. SCG-B05WGA-EpuloA1]ONI42104.1 hypothetical protein AN396_02435 [Epulopiscium sp. SCG-B11WGA-EpuloA1]